MDISNNSSGSEKPKRKLKRLNKNKQRIDSSEDENQSN